MRIMNVSAVILAAGQGTRMKSKTPKVLHKIAGKEMIRYALENVHGICKDLPVVVIGYGADKVREMVGDQANCVLQEQQLGTGHAVQQAEKVLKEKSDLVLIFYADMPLLRKETLKSLVKKQTRNLGPITMLTVKAKDPRGFGRIVRKADSTVQAIVEEAKANTEQLRIRELNVGVYCVESKWLWGALRKIKVSPKGEYYLTDLVEIAISEGKPVQAVELQDESEAIGINNRVHLAEANAIMGKRIIERLMVDGVTFIHPDVTYVEDGVKIGRDTKVFPNTILEGKTVIGEECMIGPNSIIENCKIGNRCKVFNSVMEDAVMEDGASIGPFGHLRKGAHLGKGVHMGNFGEVKNSYLGPETKMGHFSYIGDAQIARNVNIGAGTITCNFDGVNKNKTIIGEDVFIGSDTMLVAPLKIGKRAKTGAGAVVTHDVPADTTVVGVPAKELKKVKKGNS
jgi:bifunctional UDP-N-acetylglucosamine pyrophosphorylase/glucosamine-1-phosphate N-acetyltransferase